MDAWTKALEALPDPKSIASTDQKLAHANVLALVAIAQQLSRIDGSAAAPSNPTDAV